MKKILLVLMLIIVFISFYKSNNNYIIPNDSIRLRVISNSNEALDIKYKMELKSYLETFLFDLVKNSKSKEETSSIIVNNLDEIYNKINQFVGNDNFKLSFGRNYFPKKIFKGVIYNEGYYDSLVISLGDGKGRNWWCSLFPPLCLIDDNTSDVEYKFYVSRIIESFK